MAGPGAKTLRPQAGPAPPGSGINPTPIKSPKPTSRATCGAPSRCRPRRSRPNCGSPPTTTTSPTSTATRSARTANGTPSRSTTSPSTSSSGKNVLAIQATQPGRRRRASSPGCTSRRRTRRTCSIVTDQQTKITQDAAKDWLNDRLRRRRLVRGHRPRRRRASGRGTSAGSARRPRPRQRATTPTPSIPRSRRGSRAEEQTKHFIVPEGLRDRTGRRRSARHQPDHDGARRQGPHLSSARATPIATARPARRSSRSPTRSSGSIRARRQGLQAHAGRRRLRRSGHGHRRQGRQALADGQQLPLHATTCAEATGQGIAINKKTIAHRQEQGLEPVRHVRARMGAGRHALHERRQSRHRHRKGPTARSPAAAAPASSCA